MEIQQNGYALTDSQIQTLANAGVIPYDTPSEIVTVFATACKQHALSPFKKEIYLVRYQTKSGAQYHTIVGIDGLRAKAARTGQLAGRDDAKYNVQPDGTFKTAAQIKAENKIPVTCTVTVYRAIAGMRCPFTKTVVFAEYYPAVANPNPQRQDFSKAATMPFNMIEKCAEAAALRMAFADETAGLHIEEESAAMQDVTMQAATIEPSVELTEEAVKALVKGKETIEELSALFNSDRRKYTPFVEIFTDRKFEIAPELMLQNPV